MTDQIQITMPNPCHTRWDEMRPNTGGAYCLKCSYNVIDFTKMTDAEIVETLTTASGKICGRFKEEQINRPVTRTSPSKPQRGWKALLAGLAAFVGLKDLQAAGIASDRPAYSERLDAATGRYPDTITAIKTIQKADTVKMVEIRGRVVERYRKIHHGYESREWKLLHRPLAGIEVTSSDSLSSTKTDKQGYFKMMVRLNQNSKIQFSTTHLFQSKAIPLVNFLSQKRPLKVVLQHYIYWTGCPKF